MAELKIKTESSAKRCEICHQADCYSPDINYCSRCVGLNNAALVITIHPDLDPFGRDNILTEIEVNAQTSNENITIIEQCNYREFDLDSLSYGTAIGAAVVPIFGFARFFISIVTLNERCIFDGRNYCSDVVTHYLLLIFITASIGLVSGFLFESGYWVIDRAKDKINQLLGPFYISRPIRGALFGLLTAVGITICGIPELMNEFAHGYEYGLYALYFIITAICIFTWIGLFAGLFYEQFCIHILAAQSNKNS